MIGIPKRTVVLGTDADKEWERIGRTQPYYGVLERDDLKGSSIQADKLAVFFSFGEEDARRLMAAIDRAVRPGFRPKTVLDYGCGVGRVLVPLSRYCDKIIGLDISESMIAEAERNCRRFAVSNAVFFKADDSLSNVHEQVDMVHTHEVLQHIPVKRGMVIIDRLVDHLAVDGVGYLQFPFEAVSGRLKEAIRPALYRSSTLYGLANVARGGRYSDRRSEMNRYEMKKVLGLLYDKGIDDVLVTSERMGDFLTAELLFRRK